MNGFYPRAMAAVRKLGTIVTRPWYHRWNYFGSWCNICRKRTLFVCDHAADRWIRKCVWCRSTPKYRAIVQTVEGHLGKPLGAYLEEPERRMYELTTASPIQRCHQHRTNYVCSGYFSDKPFKVEVKPRVWNEDLQDLHFADGEFDLVVSSETMEHVRRPWAGFREIARVLKPGGVHCFTIPFRPDVLTRSRVDTSGAEDVYLEPKVYHLDPYRPEDSLVYTDFGSDLPALLEPLGFRTKECLVLDERCDIQDDLGPVRVFVSERVGS